MHRLREARERAGLSQNDVSNALDVGPNQVGRWERGQNIPSAENVRQLAQLYNVSADYLLGLVDDPEAHVQLADLSPLETALIRFLRLGRMTEFFLKLAEWQAARETAKDAVKNDTEPKQ